MKSWVCPSKAKVIEMCSGAVVLHVL
jgi:hypothetical protein